MKSFFLYFENVIFQYLIEHCILLHLSNQFFLNRFEGTAWLMQRHSKTQMVMVNVIVMTDVLFFILENNHKYTFFMPESNKEKETKVIYTTIIYVIII